MILHIARLIAESIGWISEFFVFLLVVSIIRTEIRWKRKKKKR